MPNNWFKFKQFTIEQEHSAMKVGTDGVMLGAWTLVPESGGRVLDVGTGTGLIALMIAQRTANVEVDAVEIDPASSEQAKQNFRNSPWHNSLRCMAQSFQEYASGCKVAYELIVCNPPYYSASYKTPSKEKNLARHDDSLSLEELITASLPLMKESSRLSLILPAQKEKQLSELLTRNKLYCHRLTRVIPAPGKAAKRLLLELSGTPGDTLEEELTIETDTRHVYTESFKKLAGDFYLDL